MLIWRGSGIAIPIVIFINFLIVGLWYEDHTLGNYAENGWVCFYSAIITLLHGLLVLPNKKDPQEGGEEPPASLNDHSFFYIPVIFWALILGALSAYFLFSGGGKQARPKAGTPVKETPAVQMRTVHILNPTKDSLLVAISSAAGYYKEEIIKPLTYIERDLAVGSYSFGGFNMQDTFLYKLPSAALHSDTKRCVKVKNKKGQEYYERILRAPTPSKNDYDDAWVIVDTERKLIVLDVTAVCIKGITKARVEGVDWTKKIEQQFNGSDLAEPLYGKDPGKGSFTVLNIGKDIPESIGNNERVFILFSAPPDRELTNEYLANKVAKLCPAIPKEKE
ncbi:MAG: hypothetical protein FD123_458 [Bacteroidetes bacterium]|nr:MAG: hypothetical protein FD123_458 [Bacteroidota bacterium]